MNKLIGKAKTVGEAKRHALLRRLYDDAQHMIIKMNDFQTLCVRLDAQDGTPSEEYDWASLLLEMSETYKIGSWVDRETLTELCCDIDEQVARGGGFK